MKKGELQALRNDTRSMVEFFKVLWDEVDAQFQGFERAEKLQVFCAILQASMALPFQHEGIPLEELLDMVKAAGRKAGKIKG